MKPFRRIALTAAAAALIVGGLFALGDWFREGIRERHFVAVNDIECNAPPGRSREVFLNEVHYYGQLPERLNVLDSDCADRLKAAFAKHPLVERVDHVSISAPNRVRVDITFRQKIDSQ